MKGSMKVFLCFVFAFLVFQPLMAAHSWEKNYAATNEASDFFSVGFDWSNSVPFFAAYDGSLKKLKFHQMDMMTGQFTSEIVDDTAQTGKYCSMQYNWDGLHMAYFDETNQALKYAFKPLAAAVPGTWTTETVVSSGVFGNIKLMLFNNTNLEIFITYEDATTHMLKVARKVVGEPTWTFQDSPVYIDNNITSSVPYGFCMDPYSMMGNFSYQEQTTHHLKRIVYDPATHIWLTAEVVAPLTAMGAPSAIKVEHGHPTAGSYMPGSNPVVVFRNPMGMGLMRAEWFIPANTTVGMWQMDVLASGDVGHMPTFGTDPTMDVIIHRSGSGDVMVTMDNGLGWVTETVGTHGSGLHELISFYDPMTQTQTGMGFYHQVAPVDCMVGVKYIPHKFVWEYITYEPTNIIVPPGQSFDLSTIKYFGNRWDSTNSVTVTAEIFMTGWTKEMEVPGVLNGSVYTAPAMGGYYGVTAYRLEDGEPQMTYISISVGSDTGIQWITVEPGYVTVSPNATFDLSTLRKVGWTMAGNTVEVTSEVTWTLYGDGNLSGNIYTAPANPTWSNIEGLIYDGGMPRYIWVNIETKAVTEQIEYIFVEPWRDAIGRGMTYELVNVKVYAKIFNGPTQEISNFVSWNQTMGPGYMNGSIYTAPDFAPAYAGFECSFFDGNMTRYAYFNLDIIGDPNGYSYIWTEPWQTGIEPGMSLSLLPPTVTIKGMKPDGMIENVTAPVQWSIDFGGGYIDNNMFYAPQTNGETGLRGTVNLNGSNYDCWFNIRVGGGAQMVGVYAEPGYQTVAPLTSFDLSRVKIIAYNFEGNTFEVRDGYTWKNDMTGATVENTMLMLPSTSQYLYYRAEVIPGPGLPPMFAYLTLDVRNANQLGGIYLQPYMINVNTSTAFDLNTVEIWGWTPGLPDRKLTDPTKKSWSKDFGLGTVSGNIFNSGTVEGYASLKCSYAEGGMTYETYLSANIGATDRVSHVYTTPYQLFAEPNDTIELRSVEVWAYYFNGTQSKLTQEVTWVKDFGMGTVEGHVYTAPNTATYDSLKGSLLVGSTTYECWMGVSVGVLQSGLTGISIDPYSAYLKPNGRYKIDSIEVTAYYSDGNHTTVSNQYVSFNITSGKGFIDFTSHEFVAPAEPGNTTIMVSYQEPGSMPYNAEFYAMTSTAETNLYQDLMISPNYFFIEMGQTVELSSIMAYAQYADGSQKMIPANQLKWTVPAGQGYIEFSTMKYYAPAIVGKVELKAEYTEGSTTHDSMVVVEVQGKLDEIGMWMPQIVDGGRNEQGIITNYVGMNSSIAADGAGGLHVIYYDATNWMLKYAHNDGFNWIKENVLPSSPMIPSMKMDATRKLHVSFTDPSGILKYAVKTSTGWAASTVETGIACSNSSICFSSTGMPRIAYHAVTTNPASSLLKYAAWNGSSWEIQTIAQAPDLPMVYVQLAIGNDVPRISYHDTVNSQVKYAELRNGTWNIRTAAESWVPENVIGFTSIAVSMTGKSVISYYDGAEADLRIAIQNGDSFETELVDSEGDVGGQSSMIFDKEDQVHISYFDYSNSRQMYATYNGVEWVKMVADDYTGSGSYSSIALINGEVPVISLFNEIEFDLRVTRFVVGGTTGTASNMLGLQVDPKMLVMNTNVTFDLSNVVVMLAQTDGTLKPVSNVTWAKKEGDGTVSGSVYQAPATAGAAMLTCTYTEGVNSQIALVPVTVLSSTGAIRLFELDKMAIAGDAGQGHTVLTGTDNLAHVVFNDSMDGKMKHAKKKLVGTWEIETVLENYWGYGKPAAALDLQNRLHVVFMDNMEGKLKHTYFDGSVYTTPVVIDDSVYAQSISCEFGSKGKLHVAYNDMMNMSLKYAARSTTGTWATMIVDNSGDVGHGNDIVVDTLGKPHISYIDASNWKVKHAFFNGSNWQVTVINKLGSYGMETSIDLDNNDQPHILYYEQEKGDLLHAWKENLLWQFEIVDDKGDVGSDNSLFIDSQNRPQICYYDQSEGDLKYAIKQDGKWLRTIVQDQGWVGWGAELVVGPLNGPHIIYWDYDQYDLIHAHFPDGTTETKFLAAIKLQKVTGEVTVNATHELSTNKVKAFYTDGTSAEVSATWSKKSGDGSIAGTVYTAPAANGKAVLYATYSEGTIKLTADYYLTITGAVVKTGDTYEADNTAATAKAITGDQTGRSIYPAGDIDWVKFTLTQASNMTIETSGSANGDTILELYEDTGSVFVAMDDEGGADSYSRLDIRNLPAGNYWVKVKCFYNTSTIDNYSISFKTEAVVVAAAVNNAPQISSLTNAVSVSDVTVSYLLKDIEGNTCSVAVEYSFDGSTWYTATAGTGGDGKTGISASDAGVAHTFIWNSLADFQENKTSIEVRVKANDGTNDSIYRKTTVAAVNNKPTTTYSISGTVKTGTTNLSSAKVTLWKASQKINEVTTGTDGTFSFTDMAAGSYKLLAYRDKYYPALATAVLETTSVTGITISLTSMKDVQLSNTAMVVYGSLKLDHDGDGMIESALAGDVVEAVDPQGVICGRFTVKDVGAYGAMSVYGDSSVTTTVDEGCTAGDTVKFRVNGTTVEATTPYADNTFVKLDLQTAGSVATGGGTKTITLKTGWNLISLGMTPVSKNIADIFTSVPQMTYVMGFFRSPADEGAEGFRTYMNIDGVKQFSTLQEMDGYHGYWVYMASDATLTISGAAISMTTQKAVSTGWNLMGYWATDNNNLPTSQTQKNTIADSLLHPVSGGIARYVMGFYRTTEDGGTEGFRTFMNNEAIGFSTLKAFDLYHGYWIYMEGNGTLDFSYRAQ